MARKCASLAGLAPGPLKNTISLRAARRRPAVAHTQRIRPCNASKPGDGAVRGAGCRFRAIFCRPPTAERAASSAEAASRPRSLGTCRRRCAQRRLHNRLGWLAACEAAAPRCSAGASRGLYRARRAGQHSVCLARNPHHYFLFSSHAFVPSAPSSVNRRTVVSPPHPSGLPTRAHCMGRLTHATTHKHTPIQPPCRAAVCPV